MSKLTTLLLAIAAALVLSACQPRELAGPAPSPAVQIPEDISVTESVVYQIDEPLVKGYLARPREPGTYPTLILIHEWWGVNDNIRQLARDFAQQGYVALAVDLYGTSTTDPKVAQELAGGVQGNLPEAFSNLEAAVAYLQKLEFVDPERLASVGWCFGGGWAYQMAKNDLGVKATVMYYGRFNLADDLEHMKADIIGHFGASDRSIPVSDVKAFQARLQTPKGKNEVYIYENAAHGFANQDNPAFNQEAAQLAWERTLAFLKKHL